MHSFLNRVSQGVRMALWLAVAIVMMGSAVRGHELTPAVADLSFGSGGFELRIEMNLEAAMARIGPEHDDTGDSPNASEYTRLRALGGEELETEFDAFQAELLDGIAINFEDHRAELAVKSIAVEEVGDTELARMSILLLSGSAPPDAQSLTFGWAETFGPIVVRTEADAENEGYAAFLGAGQVSEPIAIEGQQAGGLWAAFVDYIWSWF